MRYGNNYHPCFCYINPILLNIPASTNRIMKNISIYRQAYANVVPIVFLKRTLPIFTVKIIANTKQTIAITFSSFACNPSNYPSYLFDQLASFA